MAKSGPASAANQSSQSLLFMMIAMTIGFCVLLGGGLLMASRVINSLGIRAGSDKTTVRTPLGDYRFEKAKEIGPGLPVYPAATLVLPGAAEARLAVNEDQNQSQAQNQVVTSTYHTNSSREFVATWYAAHLSPEFARQDPGLKKLPEALHDSHISNDDIAFIGERGEQIRAVSLTADDTGTMITLLRTSVKSASTSSTSAQPSSPATPQAVAPQATPQTASAPAPAQ
jgi:hypothetical protein